ncbi:XRE family transcriptional regulator [Bordetella genomosp. 1]|uniref:XRE family transcriptional regulator n=1 Tax=Bordetella genomosp. 1 TaxID=1395607 RepID=A0A261RVW3_9BORD|nr:XRE family transcriptional regulator [Bordetella genomosp. 1]OZI29208.1 XRE family transcriptional regulator [Bordetella genomosp. 1]
MENSTEPMTAALAERLRQLRAERGWPLDQLAEASGLSRATLSRIENAEVSPTAQALGRLCAAFGLPMSRLLHMVESAYPPVVRRETQPVWRDPSVAFERRQVSPPAQALAGEVLGCEIGPGQRIDYAASPRPGMEHHLLLVEGRLRVEIEGTPHELAPGDCLRYQLHGPSAFETPAGQGARYFLFIV